MKKDITVKEAKMKKEILKVDIAQLLEVFNKENLISSLACLERLFS